jgi:hypothetical protein
MLRLVTQVGQGLWRTKHLFFGQVRNFSRPYGTLRTLWADTQG